MNVTRPVVLSVAFPYAPVGPGAVGGAEVICSGLEAALEGLGFASVVVAHADSRPRGTLYPVSAEPGPITEEVRTRVEASVQQALDRALCDHAVAVVHMHGLDFHRYRLPPGLPVVVTLHLPPSWYPETIWTLPSNYHLVCVSRTQLAACPAEAQGRLQVVPNGVALPPRETLHPAGRYAALLARICPEKNLHTGLKAAALAGMPAVLAGECFPYEAHLRYFDQEIRPLLSQGTPGHQQRHSSEASGPAPARFVGPVAGTQKARLISRAACLLVPSLAPETSSLVAMEALAAGVPVIAMAVGALPEILEHGRTGLLIEAATAHGPSAAEAMAEAIGRVGSLDREACRQAAEQRFPLSAMLRSYASLYRSVLQERPGTVACQPDSPREPKTAQEAVSSSASIPESPPTPVRLIHLQSGAELEGIARDWASLWELDPEATPFQHPAWLLPWWRQFGSEGRLHALAFRDEPTGTLRGLVPVYTYLPSAPQMPKLLLAGAGTSDYLGAIWDPATASVESAARSLRYAQEEIEDWGSADLWQLRQGSALLQAGEAMGLVQSPAEECSLVDLGSPLPAKLRANIGRYRRRAGLLGQELHCRIANTPDEAMADFAELERLHRNRWQERGEAGILSDRRVLAHHQEALPALLEAGLLRLFRLSLGETTLGVLYGLVDGPQAAQRSLYLYLIGFDLQFANLSPGTLLVHEAWQHARDGGCTRLDLLRGGEAYKQLWGATPCPTWGLTLHRQ